MLLKEYLTLVGFNEQQAAFIVEQKKNYLALSEQTVKGACSCCGHTKKSHHFDYDSYERDMWYVMNTSGLFERVVDEDDNIDWSSDLPISDGLWGPDDTRRYITENKFEV